jgi:hypothetical protein
MTPERVDWRPREQTLASVALIAAGVGCLVYFVGVGVLLALGVATGRPGVVSWVPRTIGLGVLAGVLVAWGTRLAPGSRDGRTTRVVVGSWLFGLGVAWAVGGIVDQHVFKLLGVAHGSVGWDVVFHGAGSLAAGVGWVIAEPGPGPVAAQAGPTRGTEGTSA